MEILKIKKFWGWSAFFIFLFGLIVSNSAWATGADVTVSGVNDFKKAKVSKAYIECIDGNIKPLSAAAPWRSAAPVIEEKLWDFSGSTYGKIIGWGTNSTIFVRAWAEGAIAKGNHYGYLSGTTSVTGNFGTAIAGTILANYRADKPFDPIITFVVSAITKDIVKGTSAGSLKIQGTQKLPGTGEDAEIFSYTWQYSKDADKPVEASTGGDLVITDPQQGTYHFQLKLGNVWGETAYCAAVDYSVGAGGLGGGTGVATKFTYDLVASQTGQVIVNAISSPKAISKASDLAALINAAAKADPANPVVVAIGHWTGKASESWIENKFDKSGAVVDFAIKAGEAVQVYVNKDVKGFTLSN